MDLTDGGRFASPAYRSAFAIENNDTALRPVLPDHRPSIINDEIKACKPMSRDIYIDLSASFRFVCLFFFFLFASLSLHIHTHATNYLKNLLSHFRSSFFTRYIRSLSFFFFWIFSLVFSYKTKWHLFGIGRKNTLFNVYLFLNPPLPLPPSFSLINPSIDRISDFFLFLVQGSTQRLVESRNRARDYRSIK